MRFSIPSIWLSLTSLACVPAYAVVPRNGDVSIIGITDGLTLSAFEQQWNGYPRDLADHLTPISVEVANHGASQVRVNYADFALTDDNGFRYHAVTPFTAATVSFDSPTPSSSPPLLASQGRTAPEPSHAVREQEPRFYDSNDRMNGWGGFHVAFGLAPFYGPSALYWDGPWYYPPYYWDWVYGWGPPYYPPSGPSYDVIAAALPEGVLEPQGHVDGFLYFEKATGRTPGLTLRWEAHDVASGEIVGTIEVALRVVPN